MTILGSGLPALAQSTPPETTSQAIASPQESSGSLTEIVVTAQKRSENLQKIPIAISAVSNAQLTAAGSISATALSGAVAGLSINSTATFFAPHVRGIGTSAFGPSIENPVALYVDNVYYASQLIAPTDLSDVAQVAVLKGPQGTLFGRNSTGGVIQMTTREPSADFGGELQTQLDQYLTSRNFGYVTGAIAPDLNANLSVKYTTQGDGWGKNLVTGNDNHRINSDFSIRNKWAWNPTGTTKVKLNLDYGQYRNSMGPNLTVIPGALPLVFVPALNNGYSSTDPYDSVNYMDNRNRLKSGGGSLTIEQDMGFARATSITAYRQYSFTSRFDAAGTAVPLAAGDFKQTGRQFTQELQLVSKQSTPLSWAVGVFYFYGNEKPLGDVARIFEPLTDPALGGFGGTVNNFFYDTPLKTDSIAGFGQATWQVLPGTRLTAGTRYTHEKRSYKGFQSAFNDLSPDPVYTETIDNRATESKWSWRASLDHDFTPSILGYLSFNRGFKSGGFNGLGLLPFSATPYRPEQLDAYEAGMKAELFDHKLRLNPALFYYNYTNIQVTEYQAAQTIIINGAKARLYGMDVDWEWRPTRSITFNGSFEWIDSKFKSFPGAPTYRPDPVNGGNIGPLTLDASGKQLPFTPRFTANVGANYETHLGESKVDFNVSNSFNSGFRTESDNRLRQKSYNWLNASVQWTAPGDRLSVTLWGRNLLDKAVVTQLNAFANADVADYGNPPSTYGFTLTYRFGAIK